MRRRRQRWFHATQFESLECRDLLSTNAPTIATAPAGEPELVRFRLEVTDQQGNPTNEVEVGDTMQLSAFVQDLRGQSAAGVFSPYLDVVFDANLAEVNGSVSFGSDYANARSADTSQSGLIDEVGAFGSFSGFNQTISLGGDSGNEFFLWSVPLVATAPGVINFTGNAADRSPYHDLFLYDSPTPVSVSDVDYGQASIAVVPPSQMIIDDGDEGFTTQGGWVGYSGIGRQNDVRFNARGTGADQATWTFPSFSGRYRVSTTWAAHANRATNAPYRVLANGTMLDEIRLNQELVPNDFVLAGTNWEVLGVYDVTNGPLSVVLSDDANEFVIADAVLIERFADAALGPSLQLTHEGSPVNDGGVVDFGNHSVNDVALETITISNRGTDTLTLTPWSATTLPSGFRVFADLADTTLEPGESADFTLQLLTTDPINATGTLTINSNADPISLQLRGNVVSGGSPPPSSPSIQTIDDGDVGFATQNQWTRYLGIGLGNDVRFSAPGQGNDTASWSFTIDPGNYRVATTWAAHANRATNASYRVTAGGQLIENVALNQRTAPNDYNAAGVSWEELGTYQLSANTLVVELSDAANGYVIADAVRIERVDEPGPPPPPTEVQVIDNGAAGHQPLGNWVPYGGIGHAGDVTFSGAGSGIDVTRWTFTVAPGNYRVATTWAAHPKRATNAHDTIREGNIVLGSAAVNQQRSPASFIDQGSAWEELATVTVTGTTLVVELSDAANGFVIADAVHVERLN